MSHRIAAAILLVAGVAGVAAGQQSGQRRPDTLANCSIEGQVLYAEGMGGAGQVIVKLKLNGMPMNETVTRTRGQFQFLSLPMGMYEVEVSADGYQTARAPVDLSFNCREKSLRVFLEREPGQPTPAGGGGAVSTRVLQIPRQAREEFEKGLKELHKKERPEKSLNYFQRAIELHPGFDEAYVQLALAHLRMDHPAEAQQRLETAIALFDGNARAHLLLGILLREQGQTDEAIRELETALRTEDNNWRAHFELGRAYLKKRLGPPALVHAQRAHELNPREPDVHLLLHDACLLEKDIERALAEADEFIRLFPRDEIVPQLREHAERLRASLRAQSP